MDYRDGQSFLKMLYNSHKDRVGASVFFLVLAHLGRPG